jgi:uncharacterized protein (DUF2147 family)
MKGLFTLSILLLMGFSIMAQDAADKINGIWLNAAATAKIQIYKTTSGHYAGKICWIKEPIDPETGKPKVDKRNPDKSKQTTPLLDLVILKAFSYDRESKGWQHGTIYDPKNGKDYSCKMELADDNSLKVRGYLGISLLGRTETWKRDIKK